MRPSRKQLEAELSTRRRQLDEARHRACRFEDDYNESKHARQRAVDELDRLAAERDALQAERDSLLRQRAELHVQVDVLRAHIAGQQRPAAEPACPHTNHTDEDSA